MASKFKTEFFVQALKSFNARAELPRTLATVKGVSENGYYVDVELTEKTLGAEVIEYVPVLKSKYCNVPVNEGDLVILLTFSHLLQNYLETKQYATETVWNNGYFALPMAFLDEFEHKNEFSIITPDKKFKIILNDEKMLLETEQGLKVEMDLQNLVIELQALEVKSKGDIKLESQTNLILKGNTPLEIGNSIATIGAILNDICTALNLAGSPVTTGSATTVPNPALAPKVAEISTKIGGSFK